MYDMYYSQLPCPPGTTSYIIQAGDTYYRLAARFNTTVQAIIAANPTVNPNMLMIGQRICIPTATPPTTCPTGTTPYTIRAGDTFYAIARANNISLEALIAANPGVNPDRLFIGQIICIPGVTPPPPTCPEGTTPYTIRAGDTFYAIARANNVSLDALIAANPGVNPDRLVIGQIICIPRVTPPPPTCPEGTTPYTIRAGDTFYAIARANNISLDALIAANPGVDPDRLVIGQIICIPGVTPPPPPVCPTLRLGSRGAAVEQLQRLLRDVGYDPGPIDGIFGSRTQTAVIAFQRDEHLVPDGIVGIRTWTALGVDCTPPPPPPTCPTGTTAYTIRSGDTFYNLAIRFNTTVDAIRRANPNVDPDNLRVGQIICIPQA